MSAPFDPYLKWLGIPPAEQPPNHYRLLGVQLFEEDEEVIHNAADQRMGLLRTFQAGQRGKDSQRLLNEISAARILLCNPQKRQQYDAYLYQLQEQAYQENIPVDSDQVASGMVADPDADQQASSGWEEDAESRHSSSSRNKAIIYLCIAFLLGWLILIVGVSALILILNRAPQPVVVSRDIDNEAGPKASEPETVYSSGEPGSEPAAGENSSQTNSGNGDYPEPESASVPGNESVSGSNQSGSSESTADSKPKPEMETPDSGTPDPESESPSTTPETASFAHLLLPPSDDRIPVPGEDELAAYKISIEEKYAISTVSTSAEKDQLVKQIGSDIETVTDQGLRYAMLLESMNLNARKSITLATRSHETIVKDYQVDRDRLKIQLFSKLSTTAQGSAKRQFVDAALSTSREMMDRGQWEFAYTIHAMVEPKLQTLSIAKLFQPDFLRQRYRLLLLYPHYREFRHSYQMIQSGKGDRKDLQRVGLWFCSSNKSPDNGLQLLAAGKIEDETWQSLLKLEQQTSADATTQVRTIADAYYAALKTGNEQEKQAFRNRAIHWYTIASKLIAEQGDDRGYVLSRINSLNSGDWRTTSRPSAGPMPLVLRKTGLQIPNQIDARFKRVQFLPGTTRLFTAETKMFQITELLGEKVEKEINAGPLLSYLPKSATIDPTGNRIASFASGQREGHVNLMVWNCETGKVENRVPHDFQIPTEESAFTFLATWSPDGRLLSAYGGPGLMHLDAKTLELKRSDEKTHPRHCIRYSAAGNILAFPTSRSGRIYAIDFKGRLVQLKSEADISCLQMSPDGSMLFAGSESGTVTAWDTAGGKEKRRYFVSDDLITDILLVPETNLLIFAAGKEIGVWNLNSDYHLQAINLDSEIIELDITSDGRILCALESSGIATFYTVNRR